MRPTLSRASGIRLRDALPEARLLGDAEIRVTSCSADSRQCLPGDLFVALSGATHDGHDFVREAIDAGAAAILAERMVPTEGLPLAIVRDTRTAYGRLCQSLTGHPSEHLKVIAVTGTNGKTTTSCLIASVLEAAGRQIGIMGTLGYCDSVHTEPAPLTTPPAPRVAECLARMVAAGCSHSVMEVSSHALCQGRVAGVQFDSAIVTNVRRDHLDYHGSVENYRQAKARVFELLAPQGLAVINADDPASVQYLTRIDGPVLTVGIERPAEITATVVEQYASEQTFLLTAGSDTLAVRTAMIGRHHVYNCLAAAALGLGQGIDLATIVRGLEAIQYVPGRMQRMECGQPFGVFVDYAHTPDALVTTLQTLREVTAGRVICVFGAGGDRDRQKRPLMGSVVERLADVAVLTSDNPRGEDPQAILNDVLRGCDRPDAVRALADREEAIHWALSAARPGDTVLVAGKGHEEYQEVDGRRFYFDDREVVRQWLYESAPADELSRAGA